MKIILAFFILLLISTPVFAKINTPAFSFRPNYFYISVDDYYYDILYKKHYTDKHLDTTYWLLEPPLVVSNFTLNTDRVWLVDFLFLNMLVLSYAQSQDEVRSGLLNEPSFSEYAEHVGEIGIYDYDGPEMDAIVHPLVGLGGWAYLRKRGYSRQTTVLTIFAVGLFREWAYKGWGKAPSIDDPFIFAGSALVTGLICEEYFHINFRKYEVLPYVAVSGETIYLGFTLLNF